MQALIELLLRLFKRAPATPKTQPPTSSPPTYDVRIEGKPVEASNVELPRPKLEEARLSAHFTVAEFIRSDVAARKGINNVPPAEVLGKMRQAARQLERVRDLLAAPIIISSGYRCPDLNKAVGGSANSAHCDGWAIDFRCDAFGTPLEICRAIAKSEIMPDVDQLIHEYGRWVHISFDPRRRGELLTISHGKTLHGLHPVPS